MMRYYDGTASDKGMGMFFKAQETNEWQTWPVQKIQTRKVN